MSARSTALLALYLSVALIGCDQETTPPPPDPSAPDWELGENEGAPAQGPHFEDKDFSFKVDPARLCERASPMAPAEDKERLSIPVEVRGLTDREVPVSAMSFTLIDKEGHRYRPTLAGCSPSLSHHKLTKDKEAKAEVAFDIPAGLESLELVFHPFLLGRKEVRARVRVSRAPEAAHQ